MLSNQGPKSIDWALDANQSLISLQVLLSVYFKLYLVLNLALFLKKKKSIINNQFQLVLIREILQLNAPHSKTPLHLNNISFQTVPFFNIPKCSARYCSLLRLFPGLEVKLLHSVFKRGCKCYNFLIMLLFFL